MHQLILNVNNMATIISDIDWTLTSNDSYPPTGNEGINHSMVQALTRLHSSWDKIIILTWRPWRYRDLTTKWLKDNNIPYFKLIMNDDWISSNKFKEQVVSSMWAPWQKIDWYDNRWELRSVADKFNIKFHKV